MFRSKVKQRRIFSNRRRVRRRFSWFGAIASLVLLLLVSELLTRIFVDLAGNRSQFTEAEGSDIVRAYQLDFVPPEQINQTDLDRNSLLATSSLSVGYELVGDRQSEYWQINPQGFREIAPVPLAKPKDEIRVFLLGNSTAFGYGNIDNAATISAQLEERLQQRLRQQQASPQLYKPDILPADKEKRVKSLAKPTKIKSGNYRVINAAVPGYASGNELAQLALNILKYKPDLIVVMDGYVDLMLPSEEKVTPVPLEEAVENEPNTVGAYLDRLLEPIQKNSYLVRVAQNRWQNSRKTTDKADFLLEEQTSNLALHLPADESELQKRVDRYIEHQKQILNLSAAAQAPLAIALQPEITGRDPSLLTPTEGEIATELGRTYIRRMREIYPVAIAASQQLAQAYPKNLKVIDLYRMSDKYPSPSFIDPIHLNEEANKKVAEQLYYAISSLPKMQVAPKPAPASKESQS